MDEDYDGPVIYVPAHVNNIRPGTNHPKVLVLHTPEEAADEIEVTPYYFARNLLLADPPRRASTHYYVSGGHNTGGDGDLYQMVREGDGAIANGVLNKPYPSDTNPSISLNLQSLSLEIEGYAATIHATCHPATKQWHRTVEWIESRTRKYDIPLDNAHVIQHKHVASNRVDCGQLDVDGLIAHAQQLRLKEPDVALLEDDAMPAFVKLNAADDDDDPGRVWVITANTKRKLHGTRADLAKVLDIPNPTPVVLIEQKTLDSLIEVGVN